VQILHRDGDLLWGLAHAEDQVRLGDQPIGGGEHVEAALIAERRADPLENPRHRLHVVCEHLRPGREHVAISC
jgi:hypothetical protein